MRQDQLLLAAIIVLLATSLGASIAAYHFYTTSPGQSTVQPRGSFSDDGYWNPFTNSQFWDPWSILTSIFSSNFHFLGQF